MFETSFTRSDLLILLDGAWMTLQLTFWAVLIGTTGGLVLGWVRNTLPRASIPLGWVLDLFRTIPLLIQFVLANSLNSILGLNWPIMVIGCITLGLYCAAYCTDIVRSGLDAVAPNLRRAARSLGMSYWQELRFISAPLALRVAFPSWLNMTLAAMKDTALVMWLGLAELLRSSQHIINRIQEPLLVLCIVGLIYYVMSWVIAWCGAQLERRWNTP
ncbi:amino acid ABC transporter permease [Pseudomonas putida]|uniref:amino acid ABC transporter permease n=1 Tax=Pseudomonas putida TaxID=303 RepID=UPI003F37D3B7